MSGRDIGVVVLVVIGALVLLPALGWIGMAGHWGAMGPGMMGGWGPGRWGGGWMPFSGLAFWVLVLVGIILVIRSGRGWGGAPGPGRETPLEILKRRLASGEITREEYEALRREVS